MLKISNLVTMMIEEEKWKGRRSNGNARKWWPYFTCLIRVKQDDCTKDSWIGISIRNKFGHNSKHGIVRVCKHYL